MSVATHLYADSGIPLIAGRTNLLGLDQAGMVEFVESLGEKRFRARQLLKWLYHNGVRQFDDMTDLSKAFRAALRDRAEVRLPSVEHAHISHDGTCKWLFKVDGVNAVETVFIPSADRGTLCVSSQVGCALDCSFCATARQGFNRNLTTAEIVAQVYLAAELMRSDHYQRVGFRRITNIVMMGMGEPLANFRQLVPALKLMLDDHAWGLSKRRVTVSTSGVVPAIDRLREAVDCSLAVSLHAPDDSLRDELVPINRKYPIKQLMEACRRYVARNHKTHILFEYVMLAGVNDQPEHARALAKLVKSVPCKVNLIPFNPFPGAGYTVSSEAAINRFWDVLNRQSVRAIKRRTRGDDIDAACGQLAGDVADKSRRAAKFAEPRYGESRP